MTVIYLPATQGVHDESARQNFEYIENFGVFLDQQGRSNVLQLASAQKRQCVSGWIDGRSSPPPIVGGTSADFTTSKSATGTYTITFNTALVSKPGVGLSTGLLGDNIVRITAVNAGNFSVLVENRGTGAAADDFVGFVAVG